MSKIYKITKDVDISLKREFESLDAVLDVRDAALTGYLIKILHQNGVPVTEELMNALFEAAEKFSATTTGKYFLEETVQQRQRGPRR